MNPFIPKKSSGRLYSWIQKRFVDLRRFYFYELVKIFKKRREEKISKESPIVHNLFITSDLPKIFKKNSLFFKLLVLKEGDRFS